jgi:diguanylate cyclase (GGDEF)-like protein
MKDLIAARSAILRICGQLHHRWRPRATDRELRGPTRVGQRLGADPSLGDDEGYRGGWLCPAKADRVRLTDMSPAVRRARLLAGAFGGTGVLVLVPWIGWGPAVLFVLVPGPLLVIDRFLGRVRRTERLVAASLVLYTALILAGIGTSGGARSPLLPWVAIPVVTAAARFRLPVFLTGAGLATGALILTAALASPGAVVRDPAPVIAVIVLLAALVVAQQPLLDAEIRWRRDAVLDPLTGLLNRQGLQHRFQEVAEQARLTASPVSLIICDLDEFKALNDQHGHARGDAILQEAAYLLRKTMRAFELLYRIGGEELLLILPGAALHDARQVAEHARRAIEHGRPGGVHLTASFGVCVARGAEIEFESMFESADRCLYEAKRLGRNRVAFRHSISDLVVSRADRLPVLTA